MKPPRLAKSEATSARSDARDPDDSRVGRRVDRRAALLAAVARGGDHRDPLVEGVADRLGLGLALRLAAQRQVDHLGTGGDGGSDAAGGAALVTLAVGGQDPDRQDPHLAGHARDPCPVHHPRDDPGDAGAMPEGVARAPVPDQVSRREQPASEVGMCVVHPGVEDRHDDARPRVTPHAPSAPTAVSPHCEAPSRSPRTVDRVLGSPPEGLMSVAGRAAVGADFTTAEASAAHVRAGRRCGRRREQGESGDAHAPGRPIPHPQVVAR